MAREMRLIASFVVLASLVGSFPSYANDGVEGQVVVPFSSLSASAQQEILLLQRAMRPVSTTVSRTPPPTPVVSNEHVTRSLSVPPVPAPILASDGKARVNWAIGVYR